MKDIEKAHVIYMHLFHDLSTQNCFIAPPLADRNIQNILDALKFIKLAEELDIENHTQHLDEVITIGEDIPVVITDTPERMLLKSYLNHEYINYDIEDILEFALYNANDDVIAKFINNNGVNYNGLTFRDDLIYENEFGPLPKSMLLNFEIEFDPDDYVINGHPYFNSYDHKLKLKISEKLETMINKDNNEDGAFSNCMINYDIKKYRNGYYITHTFHRYWDKDTILIGLVTVKELL